ncbi:syntaxin-related protein KNOLLE-like [Typha angustifolia]|uniref:syntaxin-related protein KNOLLE-like n=1 Tax=Typha angustifolia TaxID=59011 RepID=UPI003C2AC10F
MTDSFGGYAALNSQEESTAAADPNLLRFLEEAEAAKQEIATIHDHLTRLHRDPDPESLKSLRGRITAVRARIDSMGHRPGPAPVTVSLRAKLRDLILRFQELRDQMSAERRAAVTRCYFTITGEEPSEEAVERIMASKGEGEGEGKDEAASLFRKAIEEGGGERMDEIEYLVVEAAQGIGDAAQELEEARRYQRSSRRRKWVWIGVIVLVVTLVIVVVVVAMLVIGFGKRSGKL